MISVEERSYREYEAYLAHKRANVAPDLGATVLLSTIALGVVEAYQPRTDYKEKAINTYEDTSREMASVAILRAMHEEVPAYTPSRLANGYAEAA